MDPTRKYSVSLSMFVGFLFLVAFVFFLLGFATRLYPYGKKDCGNAFIYELPLATYTERIFVAGDRAYLGVELPKSGYKAAVTKDDFDKPAKAEKNRR